MCLPGLTRTGADFDELARTLAHDPAKPQRAIARDSRGRGRSDYDRKPANYSPCRGGCGSRVGAHGARDRPRGVRRHLKGLVGKLPTPRTFEEGADILRRLGASQFPNLGPAEWLRQSRRTWKKEDHRLVLAYDPKLAAILDGIDLERPLPPLWAQFDALAQVPLMVIRGGNSRGRR